MAPESRRQDGCSNQSTAWLRSGASTGLVVYCADCASLAVGSVVHLSDEVANVMTELSGLGLSFQDGTESRWSVRLAAEAAAVWRAASRVRLEYTSWVHAR